MKREELIMYLRRIKLFLSDIEVNCFAGHEELESLKYMTDDYLASHHEKGKSAKKVLSEITGLSINYMFKMFPDKEVWTITPKTIIKAMEQYHKDQTREELKDAIAYGWKYVNENGWTTVDIVIDEYLKNK